MQVKLINCTQNAMDLLIYTKSTRLTQGEETRSKIENMSSEEKLKELEYMASTIPSSWEFVDYVFEISGVTRAFTHQFVRTRTGSYAQQTMRMLKMDNFAYLIPGKIADTLAERKYQDCMNEIQTTYDELIDMGIPEEDARGVLPTNILTNIIAKFNLRTLAEMAKSRTGLRTQSEYRDVFDAMAKEVFRVHPWARMFLFPENHDYLADVESSIRRAHEGGFMDTDEYVHQLKNIDKLRKK